jgi:hypothetical protein
MFGNWLRSWRRKSATTPSPRRAARLSRPRLEQLEDRVVPTFNFGTSVNFSAYAPLAVVAGDFNGDGKTDLAVASGMNTVNPGQVTIETGLGNGTFQSAGAVNLGPAGNAFVRDMKAADLTGDGKLDLITANFNGNSITILENTTSAPGATPTFTALPITFGTGNGPFTVAVADLDGDNKPDIIVGNNNGPAIDILRNTSTGPGNYSFSQTVIHLTGGGAPRVAAADIFGNGKLDIVYANSNGINVLPNTSTGPGNIGFGTAVTTSVPGTVPSSVVIGDFDGTHTPEVAFTDQQEGNPGAVFVLTNAELQAGGSYPSATKLVTPGVGSTFQMVAGDFNGDGNADLAVATNSPYVYAFYGNGNGGFSAPEAYNFPNPGGGTAFQPKAIAMGDFNGDGAPDVVISVNGGYTGEALLINQAAANALQVTPSTATPDASTTFTVTVTAQSGGAAYQNYDRTVTLTSNDPAAPVLGSHTFIPADHGSFTFAVSLPNAQADTITATDGPLTGTAQVTVVPASTTVQVLPADTVNLAYNQTITPSGGTGPYTLTVGNIENPIPGLIVPANDGGTGVLNITGTPAAAGTEVFTVTTTDSLNNVTATTYSITVNPTVTLSPASLPQDSANIAYDQVITASGGTGPVSLSVTNVGNAIPGLTLPTSGSAIAITGTPTATGTMTFSVIATDSLGSATTTNYSITVNPAIGLSPTSSTGTSTLPPDTVNVPYSQSITVTGGTGPYTLQDTVSFPIPGLNIVNNGTSIVISGTPTAGGTVLIAALVTDSVGSTANIGYSLKVNAAPTLSSLPTTVFTAGVPYSQTITGSGGTGNLSLSVSNVVNSIPGIILPNSGTGSLAITGTPAAAGTMTFTVTATDSFGVATSSNYSIAVRNQVPTLSNVSISSAADLGTQTTLTGTITGPANEPFTLDVNWGDGSGTHTYNLPAGATTFSETYTYASTGSYGVSLSVGDSDYSNDLLYGSTGGATPNPSQLAVFDLGDGAVTLVGNFVGNFVTEIANSPATGQAWFEYGGNLYEGQQFSLSTAAVIGSAIKEPTGSPQENYNALTFIGNTLYAAGTPSTGGTSPSGLYILNPATQVGTEIGIGTGVNGPISGIAYDPANSTLYGIEGGTAATLYVVSLNLTTGVATNLFPTGFMAGSLSFAPDGNLYAGSSTGELYSINLTSQTVTPVLATGYTGAISGLTMGDDTASVQTTVNPAITLTADTLPADTVGVPYNQTISASGGTAPVTLSVNVTSAVAGLSVPGSGTGSIAITGTPTASGTETFSVTAIDSAGGNTTTDYSITVNPAITLPATLPDGASGSAYNQSIAATGGTGPVALAVTNIQNAIAGLSIPSNGTGSLAITGTPTASGTVTFTVTATDAVGATANATYSITVPPTLSLSGAASVNEGATYTLNLSGIDGSPNTINGWTINWGDGTIQNLTGNPSSATHVYPVGPNSYTIGATATDNVATYAAGNTVSVSVTHVPPTVSISGPGQVNKGAIYTLNLAGIVTTTHAITQWAIHWGDGSATQILPGNPSTATHVYTTAPASVTISATASDDVGSYAAGTVAVSVLNLPKPMLIIGGAASVNEGANYTLVLGATPAAGHPISRWTISWGDGSAPQVVNGNAQPVTHVFASGPHTYVISATAADDIGTYAAGNTVTVAVQHVPPTLTLSGAPSVNELATYTLTLSAVVFGGHAIDHWTVTWGDGSAPQVVNGNPASVNHVFASGPHTYVISATATDDVGTYAAPGMVIVTVKHVPPTLAISGPATVDQGSPYTLSLSGSATASHPISGWMIQWGDGSTQLVGGNPASVTHVYLSGPRTYVITAAATDDLGTYAAPGTVTVTVNYVTPTLGISGAGTVNEGSTYTLQLSATAPGTIALQKWTITWGDGSAPQVVSGNPASVTHVYVAGLNPYTVSATATDAQGTHAAANTVTVTVTHQPPTMAINGAAAVNEGSVYTLTLSGRGTHVISGWTITWGDGSVQTLTGNPTSATHVYTDGPHSYTISATASDDLGTYAAPNTVAVSVKHVPPPLGISGAMMVQAGSSYTLSLSGMELGHHVISQWTITWGDGTIQTVAANPASVTHVYAAGMPIYLATIRASATDDVGTYDCGYTVSVFVLSSGGMHS